MHNLGSEFSGLLAEMTEWSAVLRDATSVTKRASVERVFRAEGDAQKTFALINIQVLLDSSLHFIPKLIVLQVAKQTSYPLF